jgi:UDP-N-acetylmuramyl pentapeptide phosphotransferase/UDP-N-acetylglucosamine-1-phosphate transferase
MLAHPGSKLSIMDYPNERSLHKIPVPRTGGLAILLVITVAGIFTTILVEEPDFSLISIALGALMVAVVSFIDDRHTLGTGYRLLVHLGAGYSLVRGGFYLAVLVVPGRQWNWPEPIGFLFTVLFVVWMVNLYNFMDGMDGFAGGMSVFGFTTFSILGFLSGDFQFATLSLVVAASAAGFLVFNFPPAKIFMGDVGASTLGFLAAAFSLWASRDDIFPMWIGILVFSPFIIDATVTLVRRAIGREKIWQAHRSHYYQRLVQTGWGHRKTVVIEYLVMLAVSISAVLLHGASHFVQLLGLSAWALLYSGLILSVRLLERNTQFCQIKASNLG